MPLTPLHLNCIKTGEVPAQSCFRIHSSLKGSQIALQLPQVGGYLNFGALAFRTRVRAKSSKPHLVDVSTYDLHRDEFLKEWSLSIAERFYRNHPSATLVAEFSSVRLFFEQSETHGHGNLFESPEAFHSALISYSKLLKSSIPKTYTNNTAHTHLRHANEVGARAFPASNMSIGITHIPHIKSSQRKTKLPTASELESFIRPLSTIFIKLIGLIKSKQRLPHSFVVEGETVWILPEIRPIICETVISTPLGRYGTILWRSVQESIQDIMLVTDMDFHDACASAMKQLDGQRTYIHSWRGKVIERTPLMHIPITTSPEILHRICKTAHDCFWFMFALATSANEQPIKDLRWDKFTTLERGAQNQRVIKNRGHNEINISFEAKFARELKVYLEVRAVLMGNFEYDYLFGNFIYGKPPKQIDDNYFPGNVKSIKKWVFPPLHLLGLRQLRSFGLDFKTNTAGVEQSAYSAGHGIETALQSYTEGNPEVNWNEGEIFFRSVGNRASQVLANSLETAAGDCATGAGNASAIEIPHAIIPDCKNFMGCVFCQHFFIHINDRDIRKLWSMVFIIDQLRTIQTSEDEFNNIYGPTSARLIFILTSISGHGATAAKMVAEIKLSIYAEEELDPYWAVMLNFLVASGVLS